MYNAVNKTLVSLLTSMVMLVAVGALTSCSNADKENAQALLTQTEQQIEQKNYRDAIILLDTLNSRYPAQTQLRREGLRLRAVAMEGIAIDSIEAADRDLAVATLRLDSIRPLFKHITSSVGLDGYFIPQEATDQVMTSTGISPRVSEKGYFYLVANVQGKAIGLKAVSFVDGAGEITSSEISASRVVSVEGSETASFNPEDLEGVGEWLAQHSSATKCVLKGSKSNVNVKLTAKERNQLVACYQFACALQSQRLASIHREKYERMLATARDQLANLTPENNQ